MESRKVYEKEISLWDLFWKIILDWRRLLAFSLVFMILVPIGGYMKEQRSYNSAYAEYQKKIAAIEAEGQDAVNEETFTEEELQQLNDAKSVQNLLDRSRLYMQNSIYMNLNAYKENVLIMEYYVDSDYTFNYTEDNRVNYTDALVSAYENYAQNSDLAQQMIDKLSLSDEIRYVEELISVDSDLSGKSFSVEVAYPDASVLSDIAEVVKDSLDAQTPVFSKSIGSHSLKLLSEETTVRTDDKLINAQQDYQTMVNNYRNQLKTLKTGMSNAQLEALGDAVIDEEETDEGSMTNATPVEPVKPGFSTKYLVLGFALGVILSAMWSVCQILFAGRLQNTAEVFDVYGVRLFGSVQTASKKSGVDAFLLKIKNRNRKQMTEDEQLSLIASNIELVCKNDDLHQIYLTGSEWEKLDSQLRDKISEALSKAGIKVLSGGNVCYDMKSMRSANEIHNVVLIEQAGVSAYREIEQEIRLFGEQGVKVLGCVGVA
jgi:capsular polysaccharide biosynthesis protein